MLLEKLVKAAQVYQLPDLSAIGEAGVIKLVVRDKKNDTSNEYAIVVGETEDVFTFNFKVENIKIIPGAYDVVVSSKLLSQFSNTKHDLKYYIALEPDSTFLDDTLVKMRITGSIGVIVAYFIILHVSLLLGSCTAFYCRSNYDPIFCSHKSVGSCYNVDVLTIH